MSVVTACAAWPRSPPGWRRARGPSGGAGSPTEQQLRGVALLEVSLEEALEESELGEEDEGLA